MRGNMLRGESECALEIGSRIGRTLLPPISLDNLAGFLQLSSEVYSSTKKTRDESGRTRGWWGISRGTAEPPCQRHNTYHVLVLGNRNIAAEIRGRHPAAGLCCAIQMKFKCGSTNQPRQVSLISRVHILSDPALRHDPACPYPAHCAELLFPVTDFSFLQDCIDMKR